MAVRTTPRFVLGKRFSGSSWSTMFRGIQQDATAKRGRQTAPDGQDSPPLSNREAVALISAFRAIAIMTSVGFPLWSQLAAVAYDWDVRRNRFVTSVAQMNLIYPADIGAELWSNMATVIAALDAERSDVPARLELDDDTFQSVAFLGDVRTDITGARASAKFPFPACRDKKTGKLRMPKVPCGKDGKGPIEPVTGRRMPCDKRGDCEPAFVDDPITAVGKSIMPLVVGGIVLWWLISPSPRRRRRS